MDLSLFVRWFSPTGKTKVNHLQLKTIGNIEALEVGTGQIFCTVILHGYSNKLAACCLCTAR